MGFNVTNVQGPTVHLSEHDYLEQNSFEMELTYITESIIALTCAGDVANASGYQDCLAEVVRMLDNKHGNKYMILNLSRRRGELTGGGIGSQRNPRHVLEYACPPGHALPLDSLCAICQAMDQWLYGSNGGSNGERQQRVVVLHCEGGLDRMAAALAAYINYSSVMSREQQALDRLAMRQFFDEQLGGLLGPSQVRYVRYFSGLLTGSQLLNGEPVHLQHVVVHGVPRFGGGSGALRPFVKVYENTKLVYVSSVYSVLPTQQRVCISMKQPLHLIGDVLVKCYHKASAGREVVFRLQFNTSTLSDSSLLAGKLELDSAANDQRFSDNGRVELIFVTGSQAGPTTQDVSLSQDAPYDPIVQWDSYEHLELSDDTNDPHTEEGVQHPATQRKAVRVSRYFEEGPLEDSVFSKTQRSGQMNSDLFSSTSPRNGFGVTNVSSHGNVDITIIPPSTNGRIAIREQLSPTNKGFLANSAMNNARGSPASLSPVGATVRVEKSYVLPPATVGVTGMVRGTALPPQSASSSLSESSSSSYRYNSSVSRSPVNGSSGTGTSLLTVAPSKPGMTGSEQNDLDQILSELLGETSQKSAASAASEYDKERRQFTNADGSTTTIERRLYKAPHVTENLSIQKTSYRSTSPVPVARSSASGSATASGTLLDNSGTSWLEQQQQKLVIRNQQRLPAAEDSGSRWQNQPQLVGEVQLDTVRSAGVNSDPDTGGRNGGQVSSTSFKSQREILVQQQPVAYTVMITPKDQLPAVPEQQTQQIASNKKTVTNVNKTISAHYNFQGSDGQLDDPEVRKQVEEQQKRIAELEEKLRKLDQKLQETVPPPAAAVIETTVKTVAPPPEPVRSEAFARCESRPPPRPPKAATAATPATGERGDDDDEMLAFRPVGIQSLESGSLSSTLPRHIQPPAYSSDEDENTRTFNTLRSQGNPSYANTTPSMYRREFSSGGGVNGYGQQQSAPTSPRQQQAGTASLLPDQGQPSYSQQTMESRSVHQSFRQAGSSSGGAHGGVEPGPALPPANVGGYASLAGGTMNGGFGLQQQPQQRSQTAQDFVQAQSGSQAQGWATTNSAGQTQGWAGTSGSVNGGGYGTLPIPTASTRGFDGYSTGTLQQQQQQQQQQQHSQYRYGTMSSQSHGGYNNQFADSAADGWPQGGGAYSTLPGAGGPARGPYGGSRRGSYGSVISETFNSNEQMQMAAKFVKDMSKHWYKPNITRDEAISMLRDAMPGTFFVRDSNSFPGAFGLAVKVAQLPPNVAVKASNIDMPSEYVRFFLIEPTSKGVRLKGSPNEPAFGSLAALIYQHTVTPLALPCKLLLPDPDKLKHTVSFNLMASDHVDAVVHGSTTGLDVIGPSSAGELLRQGAACSVVYLNCVDTESLTGPQAISRAVQQTFASSRINSTVVNFKVALDGITITDNSRRVFFRQHFPRESVTFCGLDPADRRFTQSVENGINIREAKIFGFVAKKNGNQCFLFAEADPDQPATAIVNFVTKVMMGQK